MAQPSQRRRLLIANRGEIAYRILKTARRLGYCVIAIYMPSDAASPHVADADVAVPVSSYSDPAEIVSVVREHGAHLVIPGYGFLSENTEFAAAVDAAGAVFVGPEPHHIDTFGIKDRARRLAAEVGVPICPGSGIVGSEDEAVAEAAKIGYPGLQICNDESQVRSSFNSVVSRGQALFSNPGVFLERYYPVSRHIEVQVFGDGRGDCAVLGERECSIQRRHQKVIEESPSPFVEARPALRRRLFAVSALLARHIRYRSAGTIEYLVDDATGDFFFLEMNTRLQVEHGITELRFGIDLVALMLQLAEEPHQQQRLVDVEALQRMEPSGASIEARLYAENPSKNHMPSPGQLQLVEFGAGPGTRVDTWVQTGTNISLSFDPLLAKVMVHAADRPAAVANMLRTLGDTKLQGVVTNTDYVRRVLETDWFRDGRTTTCVLDTFPYTPRALEILSPGAGTTVQDYPGRVGVGFGIPEGGPADGLHARLANCILGNEPGAELLEITLSGPTILFHARAVLALAGGVVADAQLDGQPVPMYTRFEAPAGSRLAVGAVSRGCRTYLAIQGGFPGIPLYLGSKSTSPVVEIGGHQGRPLQAGDMLEISEAAGSLVPFQLPASLVPALDLATVGCLSGPHDSPDIMTPAGVEAIYTSDWTVSHQASRIGVRLDGPSPRWARQTGGQGGSHPSNYLDYPYSLGALNWTGDSAVVFPADAPSLGGFVSSHVIPRAELWKVGQLRPGDRFRMVPVTIETAMTLRRKQDDYIAAVAQLAPGGGAAESVAPLALELRPAEHLTQGMASTAVLDTYNDITIRQAGESYILVEFLQSLQLQVRCRVQAVTEAINKAKIDGVELVTPIGCSLLVQYDGFTISQARLVEAIKHVLRADVESPSQLSTKLSSRHIRLPMVFDDKVNRASVERYIATQRPTASYLPDPVEFIARSNGLQSKQEVLDKVLSTRILVVGVGFWSGTPIGFPVDPRCRLMVPKFNPSRTFSPAGGLGIGGCFFSCDPIDAPGGYVNFGRTLPGWDKFCVNKSFGGRPWLFQNFDQLSFYCVEEDEFERIYSRFQAGKYTFDMTKTEFDVDEYTKFCDSVADETAEFQAKQEAATAKETESEKRIFAEWQKSQRVERDVITSIDKIDDRFKIQSDMHASIYKIKAQKGDTISEGEILVILEAMKMEVNVRASESQAGLIVEGILAAPGDIVKPGDALMVLSQTR
ncbi:Allophanate hydrolase subunit 2 [Cordyceps fumosorosea ARSEF 2679]|uniref:Allophanate hydrolase subunit 2 n=1 Tax=Cordyceps fumosorosea (strain ARSEF 2679) TaxID=1081104 RepID=A0A167N5Z8_CORFA|nr:Allophanate hydrolase subunit 2 [Cordyceps fumosorosea ARSEF 2679]OAA55168.1 Allophanate hydrolase subunit 2 [Cordyceps fumosorosea ARSEF 2679]